MKSLIDFFSKYWNLLVAFVGTLLLVLSNIVKPPEIELYFSESQIDQPTLAKIIAVVFTFLLFILFNKYKAKRFLTLWMATAILFTVVALGMLYQYSVEVDKKSAYNSVAERRQVIGETFLNQVKPYADSVARSHKNDKVDPPFFLEGANSPIDIWKKDEIEINSRILSSLYLATILCFYFCLLFTIQAFYCSTRRQ